jgi:uncharacterized protein YjiK
MDGLRFVYKGKKDDKIAVDLKEPSELVFDRRGAMLVVGAKDHILRIDGNEVKKIELPKLGKEVDIEAIAYDPATDRIFISDEKASMLHAYSLEGTKATWLHSGPGSSDTDKGIEGLAFLPASAVDGRERLLALYEHGNQIAVYDPEDLETPIQFLTLPAEAQTILADLAGCGVDPETGALVILSQESARAASFAISVEDGELELTFRGEVILADFGETRERKLEGMAFDEKGDLYIESEIEKAVYRLEREDRVEDLERDDRGED